MTRQEALMRISELSCSYQHVRMTECPHCTSEVESLIKIMLTQEETPPRECSGA
jgi:hypothetical protein